MKEDKLGDAPKIVDLKRSGENPKEGRGETRRNWTVPMEDVGLDEEMER